MQATQANQAADGYGGTCNCAAARRAARFLTAVYDTALAPAGIRITQFSILNQVTRVENLTVGELARAMGMDRTTLTANLKPLIRDELIVVVTGADRRKKQIQITAAGTRLYNRARPLWVNAQTAFENAYGAAAVTALRRDFERVVAASQRLGVETI